MAGEYHDAAVTIRRVRLLLSAAVTAVLVALAHSAPGDIEWPAHGGELNIRYSPLTQVTPANVAQLSVAWTYDSGDAF